MTSLETALAKSRLVAIVRGRDAEASVATCRVLAESGVGALEVSLTTIDALTVIERVASELGGRVAVGAGTVLEAEQVERVREAGAAFVVTPALTGSLDAAVAAGLPVLAGAMTPTEVHESVRRGAGWVKLFPAATLGTGHLRALRDPFPETRFVPVGGVGLTEAPEYLAAGAAAVGVGGPLCGDAPHGGSLEALRERAAAFLAAVR